MRELASRGVATELIRKVRIMQQWEYLLEVVLNDFLNSEAYRKRHEDQLNRLGGQGWELVQITKVRDEKYSVEKFSLVFKRLK